MSSAETKARDQLARYGHLLYQRGLVHGTSGNLSLRLDDGWLVTPTNCCLGDLDPATIARLDQDGNHLGGHKPSKEAFLHTSVYDVRPDAQAIVHTHSTHSAAVSCMGGLDKTDVLPPLTAYHVMRIGTLPLIPYYQPGDANLALAVKELAVKHAAVLLANHGPVIAGKSLETAIYALEELEETAKLFFLLQGHSTSPLTPEQVAALKEAFPS